jgi:hypothetical protein
LYLLSELMLLGAVYNRYRLGQPATEGLDRARNESRQKERSGDVIKRKNASPARKRRPAEREIV